MNRIGYLLLVLALCASLTDCAHSVVTTTTYTINVVATSANGITHSVPVQLTVTR